MPIGSPDQLETEQSSPLSDACDPSSAVREPGASGQSRSPHGIGAWVKEWTPVMQLCIMAGGLIVGGIWTCSVYQSNRQRDAAQLQVSKLEWEATDAWKRARPFIRASVSARVIGALGTKRVVQADVLLSNPGAIDVVLEWSDVRFQITRVDDILPNGEYVFSEPSRSFQPQTILAYSDPATCPGLRKNRSASTQFKLTMNNPATISAVQTVDSPGVYLVAFFISSGEERAEGARANESTFVVAQ